VTAILSTMSSDPSCPFCRIVLGADAAHVVYQDVDSIAFLDRSPAARGHTLVVPRDHARNLFDIEPSSAGTLLSSAVQVARLIQRSLRPDGLTMLQANERAGGQTVFHVHLHLVPRWNGDDLITPWRVEKADDSVLASTRLTMLAAGEA
jgi:histidine triad (HIT) family protein